MTVLLLPSAEVALIGWATSQSNLAAIHGGRVGTKLAATLPAIRVTRVGGSPSDDWQDNPQIQVECWAADQGTADTLTRTFIAVLPTLRGRVTADGVIHTFYVAAGPYWAPDDPKLSNFARYSLTVALLTTTL